MRKLVSGTIVLALMIAAGQASADIIISNLPGNDATQTAGINSGTRTKGMGFTMGAGDYYLTDVTMRLDITFVDTVPVVEIFTDAGGVPGTSLTTLLNPTIDTLGIANYSFTPSSLFTLSGGTSYWVVASAADDINTYSWKASSPAQNPTGIATHIGATFGAYPPSNSSSIIVSYEINGRAVPVPSSLALLGLGGLALRRRR
jgi:hypothetical protein